MSTNMELLQDFVGRIRATFCDFQNVYGENMRRLRDLYPGNSKALLRFESIFNRCECGYDYLRLLTISTHWSGEF